jgi:hypothetical protein
LHKTKTGRQTKFIEKSNSFWIRGLFRHGRSSLTKIYQSRKENEWLQEEAQQTRRESVRFGSIINSAFQGATSLSPGRGGGGVIN